jgi:hypothetical protein
LLQRTARFAHLRTYVAGRHGGKFRGGLGGYLPINQIPQYSVKELSSTLSNLPKTIRANYRGNEH